MCASVPTTASHSELQAPRDTLLQLLRLEPRGACQQHRKQIEHLIERLEHSQPADLSVPGSLKQLEGVWELRWSSSRQPFLAVGPWLENLQCLAPAQGRGLNLLRLPGPLAAVAGIAVEASIHVPTVEPVVGEVKPTQRVEVRFKRGGWLGPKLGTSQLQWLRPVSQSFPAWLDITVLDGELRICRGNAGTLFALLKRHDLSLDTLLLTQGAES